jgi:cytochrome c554/c'-like protein
MLKFRTSETKRRSLQPLMLASVLFALTVTISSPRAEDQPAAAPEEPCLGCHGSPGMEKTLKDGSVLKLHVPGDEFAKSVHGANGCQSCHADIDPAAHPPSTKDIASTRAYAIAASAACQGCHQDKADEWKGSIHGKLVANGNVNAPVCNDCHNPHAVMKGAAAQIETVACKNCHGEIYNAYLGSVHAKSRLASKDSYAPLCSGCHTAHAVQPTFGDAPRAACTGCHADVLEQHKTWLPNAALHFDAVSCPACHVPNAKRKVELMLMDQNDKAAGTKQIGVPLFEASLKSDGKGIDAMTLWNLLQALNNENATDKTKLRGLLTVLNAPDAHRLAHAGQAISDCKTCHRKGSDAFESVSISLVGPDGRRVGYGANADVLNSPMSLGAVKGFYAVGGTRIAALDILFILAVLGGASVGIGHLALGWILRRYGLANGGKHGSDASGGSAA